MRTRAIVLGTELPRATAVIRSLGRAGIPVVAVDHRLRMPGSYSRYVSQLCVRRHTRELTPTKQSLTGDWSFSAKETLETLERLGAEGGGVLIPTNDEYLSVVAQNHARLSKLFTVACAPWEVIEPLMDKVRSYQLAAESGLNVPSYFTPQSMDEVRGLAAGLDFTARGYVLKLDVWDRGPADPHSNAFTRPAGPEAVSLIERCQDILHRVGRLPIIQELVPGSTDRCIAVTMVVDENHEPVLRYCSRRLKLYPYARSMDRTGQAASTSAVDRHPYELGTNIYAESIHDDEALRAGAALARRARYRGVITVELRRDSRDESLRFIKTDLRVVNSTALATALGLDIPTALYGVFTGERPAVSTSYPDGVAWIWIERYMRTLHANRGYPLIRRQLLATLRSAPRFRAFGFLSLQDPRPFLRACQQEWGRGTGLR